MGISFEQAFELTFDDEAFHDFLATLATELDAKGYAAGWAGTGHVESMFAVKNDWSTPMLESYFADFSADDPWTNATLRLPPMGQFRVMHELVSEAEFLNSALYNDLIRSGGDDTTQAIGNAVALPSGGAAGLTFYRGKRQRTFDQEQSDRLNSIAGDISRLLTLKAQLYIKGAESNQLKYLLDRKNFPMFFLNSSMKILETNSVADQILELSKGLRSVKGRLVASLPERDAALRDACRAALKGTLEEATTFSIWCGDTRRNFVVLAVPNPGGGRRLVLIGDSARAFSDLTKDLLRSRYCLSPTEAELVCMLATGCSANNAAKLRGVSIETIRTQYRSAMQKMDCTNLIDVIVSVRQLPSL